MNTATKSVEFSFYNNMYKQIDGVAMGSPLSVALANIFVGYHENKLFESTTKPFLYHRYVDDTFAIFGPEDECTSFLDVLNSMHLALKFTFEKEENDQHPLLDVLVENARQFHTVLEARRFWKKVLEATYINSTQPILCRQKKFVYSLQISH